MRDVQAHETLVDIQATLATLTKMALDIDPSICTDGDLAELRLINANLGAVEDDLGRVCADNNEAQEGSEPEFPFEAWDIVAQQPVAVTGWSTKYPGFYTIEPGYVCGADRVTTVFPEWYVRHKQADADAKDERKTQDAVRYG